MNPIVQFKPQYCLIYHCRFTPADLTLFRIGDVVKVQTTVSMVPVKNEHFRMIVHLQAIAMLDSKPSLISRHGPKKWEFILMMFYRKQTHIDSSPTYEHKYSKCTSNKRLDIVTQTMTLMRQGSRSTIWL